MLWGVPADILRIHLTDKKSINMKAPSLILLIGFILSSLFAASQTAPQKGYYSIHNHAEKLSEKKNYVSNFVKADTPHKATGQKVAKGYYSIGSNQEPSNTAPVVFIQSNDSVRRLIRPAITKGYYSIGNNAQKLYRH